MGKRLILAGICGLLLTPGWAEDIHWAARKNNITEIKKLLKRSPGLVHERDIRQGRTPLHFAAEHGSLSSAEILVEHKADVNAEGKKDGLTPLHLAAAHGQAELVSFLLARGAGKQVKDQGGKTPTDLAAHANHAKVLQLLLTAEDDAGLALYASVGDLVAVKRLLAKEVDVNEPDKDNNTALILAARNGHVDVVKTLLINKAQVNHFNDEKIGALQYAVESDDANLVKLMLAGGADVEVRNGIDQSLLHLAPSYAVAEVLIAVGADPNLKDAEGITPLHHATMRGDLAFLRLLVEFDADVNSPDNGGLTPLHLAAQYDHAEIAAYLLEQGADPNRLTLQGDSPLHACSKSRKHPRRVAGLLVKAGAELNAKNKAGQTPLDLEEAVIEQYIGIGLDAAFLERVHQTANLYIKHGGKNGKSLKD
jgi:ankyrin